MALALAFTSDMVRAAEIPSDLCTLLSSSQMQKTLQQSFGAPEKSTAPPAFSGQAAGTHCKFSAQKGQPRGVTLIVYVDRSVPEAKETFEKLSAFYPAKSKPSGIGDSAYIDKDSAIHVLKGKVRYYISIDANRSAAEIEKQIKDLASAVAAEI